MTLVELLHHRFLFGLRSLLVGLLLGVVLPDLPILDLRLLHSFLVLGLLGVIERIILLGPPFSDLHTDTCTGSQSILRSHLCLVLDGMSHTCNLIVLLSSILLNLNGPSL